MRHFHAIGILKPLENRAQRTQPSLAIQYAEFFISMQVIRAPSLTNLHLYDSAVSDMSTFIAPTLSKLFIIGNCIDSNLFCASRLSLQSNVTKFCDLTRLQLDSSDNSLEGSWFDGLEKLPKLAKVSISGLTLRRSILLREFEGIPWWVKLDPDWIIRIKWLNDSSVQALGCSCLLPNLHDCTAKLPLNVGCRRCRRMQYMNISLTPKRRRPVVPP